MTQPNTPEANKSLCKMTGSFSLAKVFSMRWRQRYMSRSKLMMVLRLTLGGSPLRHRDRQGPP